MNFRDRHVVITGGAGALGTALVGALIEAGAMCHVPCMDEAEAQRFALRANQQVKLIVTGSLTDEAAVSRLYRTGLAAVGVDHLAGGFAAGALRETSAATIHQQIDMNLMSCLLCCRAAVTAMTGGGRIVNVAARAALDWRSGGGMVAYTASKAAGRGFDGSARRGSRQGRHPGRRGPPSIMDTPANRRSMPKANYDLWPKVEEVATTIMFLASPENRVTRGAVVPVYGKS